MIPQIPILTLGAWLHDLNPVMVKIGPLSIHWYGVSYLAAFGLAYVLLVMLAKRGLIAIPAKRVPDALMWLVGGVLIGGRLGYVLLYEPSLLVRFSDGFPFWGVFMIHRGGMASHGGMIGIAIAAWRISRGWRMEDGEIAGRCPPMHVMDAMALTGVWGLALGRIANFVNGELLGRVVAPAGEPGPWWGVKYPQELLERWGELPASQQLAVAEALGVPRERAADPIFMYDVCLDAVGRLQRGSAEMHKVLEPLISTRHPSQLYQAFMEGIVTGVVLWLVWAKPRRPGVVGAWFLIVYGIGRILTEFVRLPDVGIGRTLGLSRGQWLSSGMVLIGVVLLVWVVRRGGEKMGGWLRRGEAARESREAEAGA